MASPLPATNNLPPAPIVPVDDWQTQMTAGAGRLAADQADDAVRHFTRARQLAPRHTGAALNLAAALQRAGRPDEAVEIYTEFLAKGPGIVMARHGLGLALCAMGDRNGALEAFREAVRLDQDAWRSWSSIAEITPGEDERQRALHSKADALLRMCERTDGAAAPLFECASALIDVRRFEGATAFTRTNAQRFQRPSTPHHLLARIAYLQGAFAEALDHKRRSVRALRPADILASPPPAFLPDAAMTALADICRILNENGMDWFLAAGTLLGIVRNGALLPHDRDVDIGVFRDPAHGPDFATVMRSHRDLMMPNAARPRDRYFGFTHRGIAIDIFVHDLVGDHVICGVSNIPGDVQWRFRRFGVREIALDGLRWRIPDSAEQYLAESYGSGWTTPDIGFASAISSPALFEVDQTARAYYSAARAGTMVRCANFEKADALLRQSPIPLPDLECCIARLRTGPGQLPETSTNAKDADERV